MRFSRDRRRNCNRIRQRHITKRLRFTFSRRLGYWYTPACALNGYAIVSTAMLGMLPLSRRGEMLRLRSRYSGCDMGERPRSSHRVRGRWWFSLHVQHLFVSDGVNESDNIQDWWLTDFTEKRKGVHLHPSASLPFPLCVRVKRRRSGRVTSALKGKKKKGWLRPKYCLFVAITRGR